MSRAYTTELGPAGSMVSPTLKIVVWAETKEEACVDWLATRHGIITGDLLHLLNGGSIPERIRRSTQRSRERRSTQKSLTSFLLEKRIEKRSSMQFRILEA
ncbi:unnamed protein product [Arabidopsis thaliana]|uniref:Uncharacterized protein n=1 Tax=Arabidopsis thaliana TaxID=3702 RepID=A0A5S9WK58_ARATH|nr:unnamed protein product [Arabidopsis thaliana]VYS48509.1 unnamed protein product [Arabidopsis thaliana]